MRIGVSGASGKLGAATVRELKALGGGHEIVAISRTPEAVGEADAARQGDYDRPETLRAAYEGLDRLLLIPTSDLRRGRRAAQNVAAIDAAVAAGVGHIVLISGAGTRAVEEPHIWASYYDAQQRLIQTAPKWSILRMNYYAESFADEAKASLAHGAITGLGENRVAFVSRDDLAAAAAGLLTGEGHAGAIYNGTGPAAFSGAERAAIVAEVSGRPVGFAVLPEDTLRAGLAGAGLPPEVIDTIVSIQKTFLTGAYDIVTAGIEHLSGKPPRPLRDVVAQAFAAA